MNLLTCITYLYIGIFSFHGNSHANGVHNPRGLEFQCKERSYGVVYFTNSFKDESAIVYTTGKVEPDRLQINYIAGIAQGYGDSLLPAIYPVISYKRGSLMADLGCLPNSNQHVNCVINIKVKL